MRQISKAFPGVQALDRVDLHVARGEVHALVGENGAGKSTLMKVLSGAYAPNAGQIVLDGQPVRFRSPRHAIRAGIAMIYQELTLAPHLTVEENILLGQEPRQGRVLKSIDGRQMRERARRVLDEMGAPIDPAARVMRLGAAERQMVAIARSLTYRAKLLVMDEPTSSLTVDEVTKLFDLIRRLRARGLSVIYISHRLEEILAVCDRYTVMRDGQVVGTGNVSEASVQALIRLMVGRELAGHRFRERPAPGPEALRVESLTRRGRFEDVSFTLRQGEILGVAGLVGAGRTELVRAIFGAERPHAGRVCVFGKDVTIRHPYHAVRHGISLLTEDRKTDGLALTLSLASNVTITNLRAVMRGQALSPQLEREASTTYIDRLSVRTPGPRQRAVALSGGNQQKIVLAKWLFAGSEILIFDGPTRGIDVAAKAEVFALMERLATEGKALLFISSYLPELLTTCDRILVMSRGRCAGIVPHSEATEERLLTLAMGGARDGAVGSGLESVAGERNG